MLFLKVITHLLLQVRKEIKGSSVSNWHHVWWWRRSWLWRGSGNLCSIHEKSVWRPLQRCQELPWCRCSRCTTTSWSPCCRSRQTIASYLPGHQFTRRHAADYHPKSYTDLVWAEWGTTCISKKWCCQFAPFYLLLNAILKWVS